MYNLTLKHHFDAAHRLRLGYDSPCQRLHGHTFDVKVDIQTDELNDDGMVIDFKKIKAIINELDHQCLNDILKFNPTAENISKYLYDRIYSLMKDALIIMKVEIWESPNASITYQV